MKTGKRVVCFLLTMVLFCASSFGGCGGAQKDTAYLISVYEAANNAKTALSGLDTPQWLHDLWPKYVANLNVMTKYMESRSWGLAWSDVLRLYSANQLISRVGITSGRHEQTMFDLYSRAYNHAAFLLDENMGALAEEILAACEDGKDIGAYQSQLPIVFSDHGAVEEIFPNLYPSMDSAINLILYTDKDSVDVMVTAEIVGFTQKYEQKVTLTPETEGILQARWNAAAWLEQSFGTEHGMLPGYQPAYGFSTDQGAYITYYQEAAIQSAISNMGVRYNMGPYSFSASQRVLMPDAVLKSGSGICIETAVETWSGSGQYFLIETTMLPFTATQDSLNSLIQPLSAEEWANYLYAKEQEARQSGGMVYVVDCDLAPVLNIQGLNY